jgi:V-type H+-transporting ATPase subunit H
LPKEIRKIIDSQNFRMLLRLLEQSKEPLVLCVAAHDIGEYVRHYPHGKKYFTLSLK